ncbi:MAG TPA: FAD-binding oxidoreductase [Bryobacteraceae bacterium]|jgi:ferredoxin--NADP+ reductase|nr:FAD-binding oxidoreductase [Bryobacteraceae bacterium]
MTPPSTDSKYVTGVVTMRRELSSELWVIRVMPASKVSFNPGQYATLGLPAGESQKMVERPYSIASSPYDDELEFYLELVPHGKLTPALHRVPVGGEIQIRRSTKGAFLFDVKSGHPHHFMVATVTGAAPYIAMLRQFRTDLEQGKPAPKRMVLLHAGSVSEELGYIDELNAAAREYSWFEYIPTISRCWLDPSWKGERGRAEDIARKYLDAAGFTASDTTAYLCGNPQMTENMKGLLKRNGFEKESVKEELYWPAEKSAVG